MNRNTLQALNITTAIGFILGDKNNTFAAFDHSFNYDRDRNLKLLSVEMDTSEAEKALDELEKNHLPKLREDIKNFGFGILSSGSRSDFSLDSIEISPNEYASDTDIKLNDLSYSKSWVLDDGEKYFVFIKDYIHDIVLMEHEFQSNPSKTKMPTPKGFTYEVVSSAYRSILGGYLTKYKVVTPYGYYQQTLNTMGHVEPTI